MGRSGARLPLLAYVAYRTCRAHTGSPQVRSEVRGLARQGVWAQGSQGGALGLPAFSAYPQASVTSVGEYLMLLPQHLEPLGAPGQAEPLDAAWLDRVRGPSCGCGAVAWQPRPWFEVLGVAPRLHASRCRAAMACALHGLPAAAWLAGSGA